MIIQENDKNWISFVFTVLPKHIKIKLLFKYKSGCDLVVKTTCSKVMREQAKRKVFTLDP